MKAKITHSNLAAVAMAVTLVSMALAGSAPAAAQPDNCLPSCSTTDGRMLIIVPEGAVLETLTDDTLELQLFVDGGASDFQIGIFDGDLSLTVVDPKPPTVSSGLWDRCFNCFDGSGAKIVRTNYDVFADPNNDGSGSVLVASLSSSAMADDAWTDFTIPNSPAALSPLGRYIYRLEIEVEVLVGTPPPSLAVTQAVKVRTTAGATIEVFEQPFSFMVPLTPMEAPIIYPNFPSLTPTTFDGTISFAVDVLPGQNKLLVWDGDMDHGNFDCTVNDTDDANSLVQADSGVLLPEGDGFVPPRSGLIPVDEGIAKGTVFCPGSLTTRRTGAPADDTNPAGSGGAGVFFLRSPSIVYDAYRLVDGNRVFVASNLNPSGNSEWEKFRVDATTVPPVTFGGPDDFPDATVSSLPPGPYEIVVRGLDLQNLNAFYLPRVICLDDQGQPCDLVQPGVGTPGFWKNHPEAWPVTELTVGGVVIDQEMAIYILDQGQKENKNSGDKTYTLGAALIAAALNILADNDESCIADTYAAADAWLYQYPPGSNVRGNSRPWKEAEPLYFALDDYNNGLLCAPARD